VLSGSMAALTGQRRQFLNAYWGPTGIGYTVGRVHMNSCDFCVASYSFDDVDGTPQCWPLTVVSDRGRVRSGDTNLTHFDSNVSHDTQAMIPLILAANKTGNGSVRLFLSPWSPPAWMKTPGAQAVHTLLAPANCTAHAESVCVVQKKESRT
jgi:glucosylceramidase